MIEVYVVYDSVKGETVNCFGLKSNAQHYASTKNEDHDTSRFEVWHYPLVDQPKHSAVATSYWEDMLACFKPPAAL